MPLKQTKITAWVKLVRFDAYYAQPFRARESNDMPTTSDSISIDYSWALSALGGCREESDAPETGPAPASENGSPAINIVNLFGNVDDGSGSQATINAGSESQAKMNVVHYFGQINVG